MQFITRVAFGAAAGVLWAAAASAGQMFKCEQDGRTTFQEKPCADGRETRMSDIGKLAAWEGCYESDLHRMGGGKVAVAMQVRRSPTGMVLTIEDQQQKPVAVRAVTPDERRAMEATIKFAVLDGLGIPWPNNAPPLVNGQPRPLFGLYRVKDAKGREMLVTALPFTAGEVVKVACRTR